MPSPTHPRVAILKISESSADRKETNPGGSQFVMALKQDTTKTATVTAEEIPHDSKEEALAIETFPNLSLSDPTFPARARESTSASSLVQPDHRHHAQGCTSENCSVHEELEALKLELALYKNLVAQVEEKVHRGGTPLDHTFHDSVHYWNSIATTRLEARLLAKRVYLRIPEPVGPPIFYRGLK